MTRDIPVPAEQAWSLLIDTDRWSDWGPSVQAVECADREIRAGSRRLCGDRIYGLVAAITAN